MREVRRYTATPVDSGRVTALGDTRHLIGPHFTSQTTRGRARVTQYDLYRGPMRIACGLTYQECLDRVEFAKLGRVDD